MGGGGDKEYERNQIERDKAVSDIKYNDFQKTISEGRSQRQTQANDTYNSLSGGLTNFANTGGITQADQDRIRGIYSDLDSSGGGGGGYAGPGSSAASGVSFGGDAAAGINIPTNSALQSVGGLGPSAFKDVSTPTTSAYKNVNAGTVNSELGNVNIPRGSNLDVIPGLQSVGGNPSEIDQANNQFKDLTGRTGGFSEQDLADIKQSQNALKNRDTTLSAIGGLQSIGQDGGISPDVRGNVQRDYIKEVEQTGGLSDKDIARIRSKAARTAPGTFEAVKDQLDRQRAIVGGTTGLASTNFKLARQAAQQQAQDKLDAEIGLAESIRAGRMDASKTLAGNELNLLQQGNATKLNALNSLGGLELGKLAEDRAGQQTAANIGLSTQGLIDSTRLGAMSANQQGVVTKINQLLDQAKSKDQNAVAQANLEIQKATGMDAVAFNNISQQLQQAAGLDQAAATNVTLALQKAAGLDQSAKDALMAEISKATGLDGFALGAVQAAIQKANASNNFTLGIGGLNLQKAGMEDSWNLNQASLAQSAANSGAANARATAAQRMAMEQYLLDSRLQGQQFGLGGLQDLRSSVPGELLAYDQLLLEAINNQTGRNVDNRNLSIGNNANNPGVGRQVLGSLGGIAAGAGAAFGGG